MKVVFFGTPQFAADILSFLLQHQIHVVAVVTKPDRPKGRSGSPLPPPVKEVALSQNPPLPVFQPEKASAPEFAEVLQNLGADLFIVAAYGEIIKQHLLQMPRLGCINVHASLLPKYRGAAPIQRCIINGEKETGVTIMQMVLKMDAGDVIKTAKVAIDHETTAGELERKLCEQGAQTLLEVLHDLEKGNIKAVPQNHEQATFAPKLELEDCEINWSWPAEQIHNLVRGVNPHPGAWCYVVVKGQRKRLKVLQTRVIPIHNNANPGTILNCSKEGLVIASGSGEGIQILELQLEGKKAMKASELTHGLSIENLSFQHS